MHFRLFLCSIMLALPLLGGCSNGGNGTPAATYKMTDVQAPANSGTEGGFVYATERMVDIDVRLPYGGAPVSLYDRRQQNSIDAAGNLTEGTAPVLLGQGYSSASPEGDSYYHYRDRIMVPTTVASLYIVPISGLVPRDGSNIVTITAGTPNPVITCTFDKPASLQ